MIRSNRLLAPLFLAASIACPIGPNCVAQTVDEAKLGPSETPDSKPHWRDYLQEKLSFQLASNDLFKNATQWRPVIVLTSSLDNLQVNASKDDVQRILKRKVATEIKQIQQAGPSLSKAAISKLKTAAIVDQRQLQRDLYEIQRLSKEDLPWTNPKVTQLIRRIQAHLKSPCHDDSTFGKVRASLKKTAK